MTDQRALSEFVGERPTPSETHECPEKERHWGISRQSPGTDSPEARYGPAFEKIGCFNGRWWAHNDEYATEVSFCPWCGRRLDPQG